MKDRIKIELFFGVYNNGAFFNVYSLWQEHESSLNLFNTHLNTSSNPFIYDSLCWAIFLSLQFF